MPASIKHFTAYSVEANRQAFNGNIDTFHLHDTYLPAFKKGVREGQSGGAMCSYASINDIPSCANSWLFEKARNDWNQSHFLISPYCAVNHMQQKGGNHYATNVTDAIVKTLKAGTDLEMGDSMYQTDNSLQHAIEDAHLASEEDVDQALGRILYHRSDLGIFDSLRKQEHAQRDHGSIINATEHQEEFNVEAASQGCVLLQNPTDMLPLKAGLKLSVAGPHAMSRKGLFEGYYGDAVCQGGGFECVPTIGEEMARLNNAAGGTTTILSSDNMQHTPPSLIAEAVRLANQSDVVVACVGLDLTFERDTVDHPNDGIHLEPTQLALVTALRRVSSNVVVALVNGGALAIEDLLDSDSHDSDSVGDSDIIDDYSGPTGKLSSVAIVEAFYPSFKGQHKLYVEKCMNNDVTFQPITQTCNAIFEKCIWYRLLKR
jgi:beta-glucosidase-like glycosyl hydrolase